LALLGCGTVGRAFVALAAAKDAELRARYGVRPRFTGGLTRAAPGWIAPDGMAAIDLLASGWPASGTIPPGANAFGAADGSVAGARFAATCPADVVIELTPLDPLTGEPATGHVRAALAAGRQVVTANKGPIAHAYRELRALARERGVALRFESTVLDGTPIFNLAEFSLPATRVDGFRGPLNSTSNFVLGAMAGGRSSEEAVADAQAAGIAEANPAYDLDGWDASVKATVLANVLMDADLRPADVARVELGAAAMRAALAALPPGHTLKQMVEAHRAPDGSVRAEVRLKALASDDPLAHLTGMETAIQLRTDTMGDLTIIEGAGGPGQTAFGVLADVLAIARGLGAPDLPIREEDHP
jgi:homoserine dehydrogenase